MFGTSNLWSPLKNNSTFVESSLKAQLIKQLNKTLEGRSAVHSSDTAHSSEETPAGMSTVREIRLQFPLKISSRKLAVTGNAKKKLRTALGFPLFIRSEFRLPGALQTTDKTNRSKGHNASCNRSDTAEAMGAFHLYAYGCMDAVKWRHFAPGLEIG